MTTEYTHRPATVDGKRAIVIGGTSGIGRAIAHGFAAEGADVIATSRDADRVAETAESLRERGATAPEVTCDVTDRDSLSALRDAAIDELGGVDVLVISASAIARQPIQEVSESDWQHVMDVQLDGVYRAIQIVGDAIDEGSIVTISSASSVTAIRELSAYSAAKGGVDALTRSAAAELAPDVRVNAVRPGFIATAQTEDAYAEGTYRNERVTERTAAGRIGRPSDVVGAVVYLASDAAGYTTGEIVTVDGGFVNGALE